MSTTVGKKINFSAGPAILPQTVFEQASQAVLDFNGSGLSILEMSHRSKEFVAVIEEARDLVKQLYQLGNDYEVLYLQNGASGQFLMVPYNFLSQDGSAAYVNTGVWSSKAVKEAKLFGTMNEVASSKDQNFNYVPKGYNVPADSAYLHLTSNNTIYGTELWDFPQVDCPKIIDMSSDLFGREVDAKQFDLIYAGAQKNLGPAGATMVAVKKSFLEERQVDRPIPSMLDYKVHAEKDSMFNTPPAFAVFVSMLTMRWIIAEGGVGVIEQRNKAKAQLIYDKLDNSDFYVAAVSDKADRSIMNVTFRLANTDLDSEFLQACADADINGIKGHRSAGGYRASIYNAMTLEGVQVLVEVMNQFEEKYG